MHIEEVGKKIADLEQSVEILRRDMGNFFRHMNKNKEGVYAYDRQGCSWTGVEEEQLRDAYKAFLKARTRLHGRSLAGIVYRLEKMRKEGRLEVDDD